MHVVECGDRGTSEQIFVDGKIEEEETQSRIYQEVVGIVWTFFLFQRDTT